jgi:hypothetical protein
VEDGVKVGHAEEAEVEGEDVDKVVEDKDRDRVAGNK